MENQPVQPPNQPAPAPNPSGTSEETRNIITVLCLIFVFPVGLILMWFWAKWKLWIKLLISFIPLILFALIMLLSFVIVATVNPQVQMQKANCYKQCQYSANQQTCISECMALPSTNQPITSTPPEN